MILRNLFLIILFFQCLHNIDVNGQDYSEIGKSINYSIGLKKAKKIKDIDEALLRPDDVIYLDLLIESNGVNFHKFYENFHKFKNLRKLVIDNMWYQLEVNFPDSFLQVFLQLEYLEISCFKDPEISGISVLKQLKYLSLDGARYTQIPPEIFKVNSLEYLDLSVCYLSDIPNEIIQLRNLRELELTNNCFTEIPLILDLLSLSGHKVKVNLN